MKDVKPFFVPDPGSVQASVWERLVEDEWEELGDHVENWDYRTRLRLRSTISVDVEATRSASRLTDGSPLMWSIGWRATDTGLVGPPLLYDVVDGSLVVELDVPADRAGTTVALMRRLVLRRDRMHAAPGEPRLAGSILWSDETTTRLVGRGAAFPTEVVDFRAMGHDPGGSWYLDLPAAADMPAMGSMILLINAADTALVAAVTRDRRHNEAQKTLIETMEEGVVEEFVRWALARWPELDDVEEDSVGSAARNLTQRVLADPLTWTAPDTDSMALKSAIVDGARRIGFGRKLG